jgi:ATP-dependent helicase HepA
MSTSLKKGMYVRVPVLDNEEDLAAARLFALAQVFQVDATAGQVIVQYHDISKCRLYYPDIFKDLRQEISDVIRGSAPIGSKVTTLDSEGVLIEVSPEIAGEMRVLTIRNDDGKLTQLPESEVACDFSAYDMDPAEMMARYEFQNPSWYASRYIVSSMMHVLHNSVYGFTELAGCRVHLMQHQISTIVRCLQSDPVRYILADEVGLGKTIESCAICKIMQKRKPDMKALFIVPQSILEQWSFELFSKFQIRTTRPMKGESWSNDNLASTNDIEAIWAELENQRIDILVIDEVHNLLADERLFRIILEMSKRIPNVLLLSATPIADRRVEYHKLLQLLEPNRYCSMPLAQFEELAGKQRVLEFGMYSLMPRIDRYDEFIESIRNKLGGIAGSLQDPELDILIRKAKFVPGESSKEEVQRIASYISENYRIEKNLIRNRRVTLHEMLPERSLIARGYDTPMLERHYGEEECIREISNWVADLMAAPHLHDDVVMVRGLLEGLFSSPWALESALEEAQARGAILPESLSHSLHTWLSSAESEIDSVNEVIDSDSASPRGRFVKILDYLEKETDLCTGRPYKVLIFSHFTLTATSFIRMLENRFNRNEISAFHEGMQPQDLQVQVDRFQTDPKCRILVCDELGGEGRNFQMADIIVHIDIPWSANTLEQRIGRLDRLGRSADKAVPSVVFFVSGSFEENLLAIWRDGLEIFTHSISGLEIIVGEIMQMLMTAVEQDSRNGLAHALVNIGNVTSKAKQEVDYEQLYDMTSVLYRPLSISIQKMLSNYLGHEDSIFSSAMMSWASQAGLNKTYREGQKEADVVEFGVHSFSLKSAENSLFAPPIWSEYESKKRKYSSEGNSIIGTFSRGLAIQREDLLFYAPGDPVFESITKNALQCSRGRSCAIQLHQGPFDFSGMVYIWNVEPDLIPLYSIGVDPIVVAQFRPYLPMRQIMTVHPTNRKYEKISQGRMSNLLSQQKIIQKAIHLGSRKGHEEGNANFQSFQNTCPLDRWSVWVGRTRSEGYSEAQDLVRLEMDIQSAREEAQRIISAGIASARYFGQFDSMDSMRRTLEAVIQSLENYKLTLDSALFLKVLK